MAFIRTMRVSIWLLCLYWTLGDASSEENLRELDYRAKRQINALPLVYPYGATYKLITGFTTPIKNDDKVPLIFLFNFQYQYVQFTNITQLSRYYVINTVSREQRNADAAGRREERVLFYRSVAEVMDSKGLNGRECVLRAICEAAQFPVEEEGFVGELLHVLLTPDYGKSPFEEIDEELKETMAPYVDAAVAGRQMFSCAYIYSGCPEGQGILEFISQLRDE
ncbi:uncharacterized protein LOC125233925 isoform X1 [Leguminivora glycinivorella]|uniref:uncharacterized protein LOC125233925 isoform X1 n=1 Tax=Leguminivora glycinivorella TaxID=1035111 RepID=UPI00200DAAB6|nr:uncharacterized protein LOC125233925 isoform X1 [Leguminivora glycinivorella]